MYMDLKTIAEEYLKVCDELKEVNESLKDKKDKKKVLMDSLLKGMVEQNVQSIPSTAGTIHLDEKKSKSGLNKNNITSSLKEIYQNDEVTKITNHLLTNRSIKKINKLRVEV